MSQLDVSTWCIALPQSFVSASTTRIVGSTSSHVLRLFQLVCGAEDEEGWLYKPPEKRDGKLNKVLRHFEPEVHSNEVLELAVPVEDACVTKCCHGRGHCVTAGSVRKRLF